MTYKPQVDAEPNDRVTSLYRAIGGDLWEICYTLVDEDEAAYPGCWESLGYDRGAAIEEYLDIAVRQLRRLGVLVDPNQA